MFVPVCMHLKTMKLRANCNYIPIFRGSGRANFEKGGVHISRIKCNGVK